MRTRALAAGLAALAVGLGAFGAHALREHFLAMPRAGEWWQTATLYLLIHAAVAALLPPYAYLAQRCLLGGALLFSGTLYAMALGAPLWLGAVTPIGGVLLLIGWCAYVWSTLRQPLVAR